MEGSQIRHQIRSSWHVRHHAGEPFAVVRVRNLQAVIQAAQDAWGRSGKAQPLLVSAEVSFSSRFENASATDKVTGDTVHYGNLSKAILASLERYSPHAASQASGAEGSHSTLRGVLDSIWSRLTGAWLDGTVGMDVQLGRPFLNLSRVRLLSVEVSLPKASLLGEGVSLAAVAVFESGGCSGLGASLHLKRLRVPTLIGVNANERLSRQVVITDVEIDKFDCEIDVYTVLEDLVVKELGQSSFETLEALAAHLAEKIQTEFRPVEGQNYAGDLGWQVGLKLEKPTAVPFADGPVIEIRAGAGVPT